MKKVQKLNKTIEKFKIFFKKSAKLKEMVKMEEIMMEILNKLLQNYKKSAELFEFSPEVQGSPQK